MVTSQRFILLVLINVIPLIISAFIPGSTLIALVFILWLDGIVYSLMNMNKNGALFCFLISFFIFLIGTELLERFKLHEIETVYSSELNFHAELLLFISLLALFIGYYLSGKVKIYKPRNNSTIKREYNTRKCLAVQEVSRVLFFLTFAFNLFTLMDIVLFVFKHGYISFYASYVSSVPYIIKKIGDMCLICFWIFLATMPEKRKVDRVSFFYLIYLLVTLGTGKRFPFVAGLLTLFIYYLARNEINPGKDTWLKKKTIVSAFIIVPIIFGMLYLIGEVRMGRAVDAFRIDKALASFLYDQGGSINIIKRLELYASRLPVKHYLFGSTYEAISNNIIFRLLGFPQYSGNTVQHALEGYSFQHALSYITMGNYYLSGHGLGSCYIAEAYHDLGYLGVVIVNLIYGVLFRKLFDFKSHGIWLTAIILSMLNSILLAPRGSADGFLTDIVDLTTWGTLFVVWAISTFLVSKKRFGENSFNSEYNGIDKA